MSDSNGPLLGILVKIRPDLRQRKTVEESETRHGITKYWFSRYFSLGAVSLVLRLNLAEVLSSTSVATERNEVRRVEDAAVSVQNLCLTTNPWTLSPSLLCAQARGGILGLGT